MSKWIEALPCISFTVAERKIARKHGFLSWPEFHDNYYISEENRANFKRFIKSIVKHKHLVIFAVYPDNRYDLAFLNKNYSFAEWIFPMHKKSELDFILKNEFQWIGMPHDVKRRDFSESWFIDTCNSHGLKKWYLGFWAEDHPEILHHFEGMDSTLPETYSGKYGKLWSYWLQSSKPYPEMPTKFLLEQNIRAFRNALDELSMKTQTLISYTQKVA